jgi:hypothetical protein
MAGPAKGPRNMDEPPKYTLAQALDIAHAQSRKEPPALWAPGMDQPPPVSVIIGQPIPEGVIVHQPVSPEQKPLALKQVERSPARAEQEAFNSYWPAIEAKDAVRKTIEEAMKAENLEWGFLQAPESIAQQKPLPEGVYSLDGIIKEPWCRCLYKTKAGLVRHLLQPRGYPPRLTALGLLARAGYDILISRKLKARQEKDQARKEKATAAKRAADQDPEPVNGPVNASPNQPFKTSSNEITRGKSGSV